MPFDELKIQYLSTTALTPSGRNARTHSKKQVQQLAKSIREFGFTVPIIVDSQNHVLAGHGRLEAAKLLGLPSVPCVTLDHLTEVQKRAYMLADNKLALNAGWDVKILAEELGALVSEELSFDLELTGFSLAETDLLIGDQESVVPSQPKADARPHHETLSRVQLGDIWDLGGRHRLICGAALDASTLVALMKGERAQMVVLDQFGDTASTLITAHKAGRRVYLCERDPVRCDRVLSRWESSAKVDATLSFRRTSDAPAGPGNDGTMDHPANQAS